jgi:hypothetical protein
MGRIVCLDAGTGASAFFKEESWRKLACLAVNMVTAGAKGRKSNKLPNPVDTFNPTVDNEVQQLE